MGLLPRDNLEQILFAFKLYVRTDEQGEKLAAGFKQTYCQNVTIEFVGAWYAMQYLAALLILTLRIGTPSRASGLSWARRCLSSIRTGSLRSLGTLWLWMR